MAWAHWALATGTERRILLAYERDRKNWRQPMREVVLSATWRVCRALERRAQELTA